MPSQWDSTLPSGGLRDLSNRTKPCSAPRPPNMPRHHATLVHATSWPHSTYSKIYKAIILQWRNSIQLAHYYYGRHAQRNLSIHYNKFSTIPILIPHSIKIKSSRQHSAATNIYSFCPRIHLLHILMHVAGTNRPSFE
jgi:hypothetical protein